MALTSAGWVLTVTLIDHGANTTTKRYQLTSASAAEAATDGGAIISALDAVTGAVIKNYSIGQVYVEDTLVLPGVAVEIENLARVVVGIDGEALKKWTHDIPAPVANLFIDTSGPGANIVDTQEASLVTYMSLFDSTGEATVSDGESIELPILSGKRVHRKSNGG